MNKTYLTDGFYRLENGFSGPEIAAVRRAFVDVIASPPEGVGVIMEDHDPSVVRSIMGWQRAKGVLSSFAADERVMQHVRMILGDQVEYHQTKYNPKAADNRGEKWDPHRGDTFWCWKDGVRDPTRMVSVFIALTDQTEQNGAVYAWKGSHVVTLEQIRPFMLGLGESGEDTAQDTAANLSLQISPEKLEDFDRTFERVMLTGPAGTVWVLHAGLLHASQANHSNEVRELVANVFRSAENSPSHPRQQNYLSEPAGSLVAA